MQRTLGTTHFARLLDRVCAGDPSSKEELIHDAYWRVHRRAHYILEGSFPNAAYLETDDVVSVSLENFARTLREGIDLRLENPAALFGYVDQVIRHVVIDMIRQRTGRQFRTQFPGGELPDDLRENRRLLSGVLGRLSFEEIVEGLPEDEQQLINFRFIRGLTDDEIAELCGCDRRTVARKIRRILLKLRAELDEQDGELR
jgi:RNA polymerase sigma factor (sigma-70 family)